MIEIKTCLTKDGKYKVTKKHHKLIFDQVKEGNLEFINAVLDASPEMVNLLGKDNRWYRDKSPLMYAFQCGQAEMCTLLIDRGAGVDFAMPEGQKTSICYWSTVLATRYGDSQAEFMSILKRLLELGANPNHCDYIGRDAMYEAISQLDAFGKERNLQIAQILIDAGADPERKHKKLLLKLVKSYRVRRHGEQASPNVLPPEIYEIYGITKSELELAIKAGVN